MTVGSLFFFLSAAVLLLWATIAYNRLVGLRNACRTAFERIDAPLKQRHDLLPEVFAVIEMATGWPRLAVTGQSVVV
jgi:hypothetical protein